MAYMVKEIFYTLQGEGANAGRPAVFCRFAGCNLWSGREEDRGKALCQFCDTDFVGTSGTYGGRFDTAAELASRVASFWPANSPTSKPLVVCTGGEPLLQLDRVLIDAFHQVGLEIAIETNGTIAAPEGIDWVCVSPKAATLGNNASERFVQRSGHELKVVWPQTGIDLAALASLPFTHRYLQPMDVADPALRQRHVQTCIDHCLARPEWRLSLQTHKITGIR
jgi:7-carboxy-7-deazaguanine synthase (Cx14CxxC type)